MSHSVKSFQDLNSKIRSLLKEPQTLDSIVFTFQVSCRYKFSVEELGIRQASDLLLRHRVIGDLLDPRWNYTLYYPVPGRIRSIQGFSGYINKCRGSYPGEKECHVFIDSHAHLCSLLYWISGGLTLVQRTLPRGSFCPDPALKSIGFRTSSWIEINHILSKDKE